ncbi:hypothetical protein AB685_28385 [Bacillus sp. LL01]|uniref:hypothetical protein n=1 Tax=Bacillus sp. LL01 TaxID=1665556 RepID=UPI00064D6296|nr:hypothetical protein [Bacillus sp. LL01]KMJ55219.1 hypothetical protein AB685_28385 [Bacillus sp. LL01]
MSNEFLLERIVKVSAETAVRTAIEYMEKEKMKEQKNRRDMRLRNTKLLLKHYRSFVLHSKDLQIELDELEVPDDVFEEMHSNELVVESIKRSKKRTLAMVKFIDQMLRVYNTLCEESGRLEEIRQFQTIHKLYISEEKFTIDQVAECHNVVVRTVQRDTKDAVKTLSALIFGIDSIRFDC